MKKLSVLFFMGAFAFILFTGPSIQAQNAVVNPFFSTMDWQYWTGSDPTLNCVPGNTNLGMDWYCLRKSPGTPLNNGSITQDVHLIEGYTYNFSANIASTYACPS